MFSKRRVSIFGVTGSVGRAAMDVLGQNAEQFTVDTVTAGQDAQGLAQAAIGLCARRAIIADERAYDALQKALSGTGIEAACGAQDMEAAGAEPADVILAASVGFSGLRPILAAIRAGRRIAIANKEPIVAAGHILMPLAQETGAQIIPVDSEHNALFQVFDKQNRDKIRSLTLTASGGPFLSLRPDAMAHQSVEAALAHPTWQMGPKISVDSATMMNKALEVIEAHYLFGLPSEKIKVLIHPQSIVHGLVTYADGSVLAQMGPSDMRVPIAHALGAPERLAVDVAPLDLTVKNLSFQEPDAAQFPALGLAYDALMSGPEACIALNAANEVAVAAFLSGRITFGAIVPCVREILYGAKVTNLTKPLKTVEEIEGCDTMHRAKAALVLERAA